MPDWIILTLIGAICSAAFFGVMIGILVAQKVIRVATERTKQVHLPRLPSTEAHQVLEMARDLHGFISAAALDQDLRGGRLA